MEDQPTTQPPINPNPPLNPPNNDTLYATVAPTEPTEPKPPMQPTEPTPPMQPTEPAAIPQVESAPTPPSMAPLITPETPQVAAPEMPTQVSPKYSVHQAIGEGIKAVFVNIWPIIGSTFLISVVIIAVTLLFVILSLIGILSLKLLVSGGLIYFGLVLVLALVIISAISTLATTSFSIAIMAGAENQRIGLIATLKAALSSFMRVFLASAVMLLIVLGPLLALILLAGGLVYMKASTVLAFLLPIAGIIWVYIALLRFALVPYVALFEPSVQIFQTLGRSTHLLEKGGQWFIVKGVFLLILVAILGSVLTGQNLRQLQNSNNPVIQIVIALLSLIMIAVMVMLYRNRRIVRG